VEAGASSASPKREQKNLKIAWPSVRDNHTVDPNRCAIEVAQSVLRVGARLSATEVYHGKVVGGPGKAVVWMIWKVQENASSGTQRLVRPR
jgi:hypothetical protein